ncbi:mobilization protein [Campylobacter coli]|nr:mobilization protein [Campylobacter coli]EFD4862324.1 mobilization protein [Campylobacter coli]
MEKNTDNMQTNDNNNIILEKNENLIPKRVLFDKKTLKMIEMMIPAYKDEISNANKENEKINQMVKLAIEKMFKNDFLTKINNF